MLLFHVLIWAAKLLSASSALPLKNTEIDLSMDRSGRRNDYLEVKEKTNNEAFRTGGFGEKLDKKRAAETVRYLAGSEAKLVCLQFTVKIAILHLLDSYRFSKAYCIYTSQRHCSRDHLVSTIFAQLLCSYGITLLSANPVL